jgi:hypothetical protein
VVADEERKLWHAALRSLTGHRRVIWDFADHEGFGVDNDDLDHGARLWSNLLGLGEANAFLEQENRTIETLEDGSEVIVATAEDYKVAYELVEATATRSMVNVSDSHRKILNAMHELQDGGGYGGHSQKEIAEKAGVHPSTVTRNKTYLTKSVKFITEDFDGELKLVSGAEPSWWEEGEPMRGFPKPETVEGWSSESVAIPRNRAIEGEKPDTYAAEPVAEACNHRAIVAQEDDADPLAEGRGAPDVLTAPVSWEADGFEIEYMPDDADRMVFDALVEVCNEHPEKRGRAQRTLWLARAEAKGVSGNEFLDAYQDLDRVKRIKLEVLNDLDVGKWYPSEAGHSRRSLLTIRSGGTR